MRHLLIVIFLFLIFACQQKQADQKLLTDNFKYSAYSWQLNNDTPKFYLAHYLEIDKNGHFIQMRHDTFIDTPKYFMGNIPDTLRKAINEVSATDHTLDYSIKPEDSFIYDGFTYCIDYKKRDGTTKKVQFIPPKSPAQIRHISLLLDKLIYVWAEKGTSKFDIKEYTKELANYSLQLSGPLPKLEKPNIEIRSKR